MAVGSKLFVGYWSAIYDSGASSYRIHARARVFIVNEN